MPLTENEEVQMLKLVQKQKYIDEEFPPSDQSIGGIIVKKWKRPHELVNNLTPQLFVNGASDKDVMQGELGDCWFLSVAAVVARYPHLIRQVIPENQYLSGSEYTGLFAFRFWNLGQWTTVYIDDNLPVDDDDNLVFGKCTKNGEFWLPLLEKAFAKFHGSYEKIDMGSPCEALLSLTGYLVQGFLNINFDSTSLYRSLSTASHHDSLIVAGTMNDDWEGSEKDGIFNSHAYSVIGTYAVRIGDTIVRLVRLRNPYGKWEWQGQLNNKDPKWTGVDKEILKKLDFVRAEDGQFFMKLSHFKKYFTDFWLAASLPDFGDCFQTPSRQTYNLCNSWKTGRSAGGSNLENAEEFLKNPKCVLTVGETDGQLGTLCESEEGISPTCDVIIQLIQEQNRAKFSKMLHTIGITVFQIGGRFPKRLTADNLKEFEPLSASVAPTAETSAVARLSLAPGRYMVVPTAEEVDISRKFLLRVYSRKPIHFEEEKRF